MKNTVKTPGSWSAIDLWKWQYDPSAWTPNSEFMQSLFCNHSAIFTVQSSRQSLLCYVFLQYVAENIEKPLVFLGFLNSDCKKPYKTCAFCNILLKMLKNHWFSLVFASRVLENLIKSVLFAIFCWKQFKTICFPFVF